MERRDVRVSHKRFGISAEHVRVEKGEQSHGSVTTGSRDDRFHLGVEPDAHQVFSATLVLTLLEAAEPADLVAEDHFVTCFFHCLRSAKEPSLLRGVRRSDHADGIAFDESRRSNETRRPRDGGSEWNRWRAFRGRHCLFGGVRSE